MASMRIVYIRAVDLRPLYIRQSGTYHLVLRIVGPHRPLDSHGYFIRTDDQAEIETASGKRRILITPLSEFTDEPKLIRGRSRFA